MKRIRFDEVRSLIPDSELLRPLLDLAASIARPDPDRSWAGSGELETLGDRLIDPDHLAERLPRLLEELRDHVDVVYGSLIEALHGLAQEEPKGAADAILRAASAERLAGRTSSSAALSDAAVRLSRRFPDRRQALPVLLAAARIAREAGLLDRAEARYLEAMEIARALGDRGAAARSAVGLGNLLVDRGRWTEALERYDEADAWVGGPGAPLPESWHLPLNRSIVARQRGRHDEARMFLHRAREAAAAFPDEESGTILDNAEGQILQEEGRLAEAEIAYRLAMRSATHSDGSVTVALNLAETLLLQGRGQEAGELLREAETRAIRDGVVRRLPELYTLMGRVASERGIREAFVFFERALAIASERELPPFERAKVLEAYAAHELQQGEREVAISLAGEAATIYRELKDPSRESRALASVGAARSTRTFDQGSDEEDERA